MSRKGNCRDNAVAESFFGSLKKERSKKHIYKTRDLTTNLTRRHSHVGRINPEEFEATFKSRRKGVHWIGAAGEIISRRVARIAPSSSATIGPMKAILESTITCPVCGFSRGETMPVDACIYFYECTGCKTLLKSKPGDCCVFCSFGSVKCPPIQEERSCCSWKPGEP